MEAWGKPGKLVRLAAPVFSYTYLLLKGCARHWNDNFQHGQPLGAQYKLQFYGVGPLIGGTFPEPVAPHAYPPEACFFE